MSCVTPIQGIREKCCGRTAAFTLIEVLLAAVAGALILAATYTVFSRAIHLRDSATERTQEARLYSRAAEIIRNDLRNGLVSGGRIASGLEGSLSGQASRFPGYLRLTTTTADTRSGEIVGDVQEVEYYVSEDENPSERDAGMLVRTVRRNLLTDVQDTPELQQVLPGVSGLEVSFYDGQSWIDSWEVTDDDNTTPTGIRVVVTRTADPITRVTPPPIEVVVPWVTVPLLKKPDDQG